MSDFLIDLEKRIQINSNYILFILDRQLYEHDLGSRNCELPEAATYGHIWLIKMNNILQISRGFSDTSENIRFESLSCTNIRLKTNIIVYNNPINNQDYKMLHSINNSISYNLEQTHKFVWSLLSAGYKLYLKKKTI